MQNEIVIFKALTTKEKLAEIKAQSEKHKGLVVDMDDALKRKEVKEDAKIINDLIKAVDRFRIDDKASYGAAVESEAGYIISELKSYNVPLDNLINGYKEKCKVIADKEKARCAIVEEAFAALNDSAMEAIAQTSTVIEGIIDDMESWEFHPDVLRSRTDEFVKKHSELMGKLQQMLNAQVASEELESKRAEVEEKERLQHEADQRAVRIKREIEIAEQAKLEAEDRHAAQLLENAESARLANIEREKRIESDKIEAEAKAKIQAEQAAKFERDKIAAEQAAEKAKKDKLEANRNHVGSVRCEIKEHIMLAAGLDNETALKVVKSLLKTERITINY